MGFEPTRAEPIGLAVQRLNHSATSSMIMISLDYFQSRHDTWHQQKKKKKKKKTAILHQSCQKISHAGSWTRASWVKARYPSR